jgi:hypothetical protein
MKKSTLRSLIAISAAGVLTGCVSEKCEKHHNKEAKQARLMAEAKVSKADAEKIALAKVSNGAIKEAELEKGKGKLIWSFDITTPDTKDITEVNVDAITGDVVSVEKKSAEKRSERGRWRKGQKVNPQCQPKFKAGRGPAPRPLVVDAGNAKEQKLW